MKFSFAIEKWKTLYIMTVDVDVDVDFDVDVVLAIFKDCQNICGVIYNNKNNRKIRNNRTNRT